MVKEMILLKGRPEETYVDFKSRTLSLAEALARNYQPGALKLTLTMQKPPLLSVIPFKRDKVAIFSLYGAAPEARKELLGEGDVSAFYQVEEAIPVQYKKSWEDGERTPGICLLTLFHRKPGIGQKEFLKRWHEGHTPLSLKLHPLWNYNRNVVLRHEGEASEAFDGIVEEHFRNAADLLNPFKFFGPTLQVPRHMALVLKDTRGFIDMSRMETYLAAEYHITS